MIKKANENFKIGNFAKSIKALNELIRRNPYNPDLFYMRIKANQQLNNTKQACLDYWYLKVFLQSEKVQKLYGCDF